MICESSAQFTIAEVRGYVEELALGIDGPGGPSIGEETLIQQWITYSTVTDLARLRG